VRFGCWLSVREKFLDGKPNIARDLAQEGGGDVPSTVERHGRRATIGMSELLVRPTLSHLNKTQGLQQRDHFAGLEDRD